MGPEMLRGSQDGVLIVGRVLEAHLHFGVLLGVHDRSDGNTEVGGRAPEICRRARALARVRHHASRPLGIVDS